MAVFSQPACNNNEVIFTFLDDLKSKIVFINEDKIMSFETR